jgi:capsular polysaccharide biosynthesis protein
MISISQEDEGAVFRVSITSTNPELAYDVALAITSGIETYIQGESGLVKNALLSSVLEDPSVPQAPNSKNALTKAIIAFLVGFVVTAAIVWAHSFFDVVIRSAKKIEDNLDIPILGVIPRHEISVTEEGRS